MTNFPTGIFAAHRYRPQDHGTIDGYVYCTCGWAEKTASSNSGEVHGRHLESVLRKANWEFVLLPEDPVSAMRSNNLAVVSEDEFLELPIRHMSPVGAFAHWVSPEGARRVAAAWLAAAWLAEQRRGL